MNKFGKLTIIGEDVNRKGYVICECECGNVKSIRMTSLTKKKQPTISCGCIQKSIASKTGINNIKENSKQQIETNVKFNTNFQVIKTDKPPVNNTSGHKGVSYSKSRDMWEAYINVHNRKINLGRYKTLEEAIEVRKNAEEEWFKPLIEDLEIANKAIELARKDFRDMYCSDYCSGSCKTEEDYNKCPYKKWWGFNYIELAKGEMNNET